MNKKMFIGIAIAIILVLIGIFFFFRSRGTSVEAVDVKLDIVEQTVSANGEIMSLHKADLAFASTGKITSMNVKEGDKVAKSKTLAQLYAYPLSQTAQATKDARDIAIRNRDLYVKQNEALTRDDGEYDIKIRTLNEQVSQAEASYQASLGNISNLFIKAPFGGTILDVTKELGEVATAGVTIIKMADLDNVYMEIELDQEDFGLVQEGANTKVELDAYDGVEFTGTVLKLPSYVNTDSSGQTFMVKIKVEPQEKYPMLLGMTGDARITVDKTITEVTALDFDIIQYESDKNYFIWIVDNGNLKKVYVEIGLEGDLLTEVITDISEYTVVTNINGNTEFEEGIKAKIVE